MPLDEQNVENEIQAKGLNAPRLTPALIDGKIRSTAFHVFPGTSLTICAITLANGFQVTGESAAASLENFDREIGEKIAFDNARNKIWMLEGYLLRERLASQSLVGEIVSEERARYREHMAGQLAGSQARNRRTEIVTRDVFFQCWRNKAGDMVPDAEVVRQGDYHLRFVTDVPLGDDDGAPAGKIIGHDRSEEGAPSFKG